MKCVLLAIGVIVLMQTPVNASPITDLTTSANWQQSRVITGKVTGENGEPLANVTIQVKGTNNSSLSGADGNFSIDVPQGPVTLVFSYVGMQAQEVPLGQSSSLQIKLSTVAGTMSDVVVIGYGTQRKANLTGSVSMVTGATLTQRPAPNAANLLQGRVTGLQVTQPSGEPGRDNPVFRIRGRGSFGASSDPLVLIDGVAGNINNLSPDDIENVTVLKDAASSAIYGSRAANGVILVTTKKGRRGQTTVSYKLNVGRHVPTALPDFITNSAEYMEMYNRAAPRSNGVAFRYPQAEIDKYKNATDRNQYPNFNTVDYYIRPATVTNHNLSMSGGSEKSTFNLSLGYLNQDAMIREYDFKRYTALLNYTNEISKLLTFGTTINASYKDRQEPPFASENITLAIYAAGPLYGPFLPDGSGRVVSRAYQSEGRNRNPQEFYAMGWQNTKEYNVNGQAYLDVRPFKGFTWSSKVAVNYVDEYYKMYQHPYQAFLLQERDPATGDYISSSFGPDLLGVTDQYAKFIQPTVYSTLNYETRISEDHSLKALAGYEQVSFKQQSLRGRRVSTVAPVITDLTGYSAANQELYNTWPRLPGLVNPAEWALQSVFGRVNYDYKGKYLLEANIRYDGTSRVSPEYRWGLFPSVSAAWVISSEDFLRDRYTWLSLLKLRASYGELGNQDIGTYPYQNVIDINVNYPYGNSLTQGAVVNTYRDQSLQWETTRVTDLGFDFSMTNGMLGITFDWFKKYTYDILASQPIPLSVGLSAPTFNNGKLENTGFEVELTHRNRIGKVSYGVNAQVSAAKNKVVDIKVPSRSGTSIRDIGYEYDGHFLYIWDGIFQVEDTMAGSKVPRHTALTKPGGGDLKMKDMDGDGDVDQDDRVYVKGAYPDFIYSFGFNVDYKGFGLVTFFQGVEGLKARVNNWGVDPFHQGAAPTEKWRNAWTPQNKSNTLPALYLQGYPNISAYNGSTYFLQDASYLRLKNVMLSYTFPKSIFSRIKAKDLLVYMSVDNLFTITDYDGADPERASVTGNYAQFPQAKIFNVGLNVKF